MSENVALALARRRVKTYMDESASLMARHADAMECRDCEDFLRVGIDAFTWLTRADDMLREAAAIGLLEFSPEIRSAFGELYEAWLQPAEFAERWIEGLQNAGYAPDNVAEFRSAIVTVRDIVERQSWQNLTTRARLAATTAEEW